MQSFETENHDCAFINIEKQSGINNYTKIQNNYVLKLVFHRN